MAKYDHRDGVFCQNRGSAEVQNLRILVAILGVAFRSFSHDPSSGLAEGLAFSLWVVTTGVILEFVPGFGLLHFARLASDSGCNPLTL
jgi:hypothetical protein